MMPLKGYIASMRRLMCLLLIMVLSFSHVATPSYAQSSSAPVLIRDTEIEEVFKEWAEPLLKEAKIPKDSVNIILVQSNEINAFVAGGANIFFYTGLIKKTDGPEEILGVLAHEIGHIAGGHLIKTRDAMERASYESIVGMVLGIGAAIASGQGGAASAIIQGTQQTALRRFLAHSRTNESSADQAAFSYLKGAGITPRGLSSFFDKLKSQELLPSTQQSEYMRTHPITRNRVEAVDVLIAKEPELRDKPLPQAWVRDHARMKAKLIGFINPGQVAWNYDDLDTSVPARYARSIAAYKHNDIDKAIDLLNGLIEQEPNNPYFYELKGQILLEFSRVKESFAPYKRAIELKPDAALIRMAYAHALIESGADQARYKEAAEHLEFALTKERYSSRVHRLLATAYGRLGQENLAKLHLAEEAVLTRRLPYARAQAASVLEKAPQGSREWIKAKDVLVHIENLMQAQASRG